MHSKLVSTVDSFIQEVNTNYQLTHIHSREDLHKLIDGKYLLDTPRRKTMPKLGPCQFIGYGIHKKLEEENIPSEFIAQKIVENGHNFLHFLVKTKENYIELLGNVYISKRPDLVLQKSNVSEIKGTHTFSPEKFPEDYDAFWNSAFTKDWAGRYTEKNLLDIYARMPSKDPIKPNYQVILSNTLQ